MMFFTKYFKKYKELVLAKADVKLEPNNAVILALPLIS